MRKHDVRAFVLAAVAVLVVAASSAATLSTGFRERHAVGVDGSEALVQSDPVTQVNGSWFDKTGTGTWKLPLGAIHQDHPLEVGVRAGTLEVALDETARTAPAVPDVVAAKAALWLDAGENVVTTNAEGDAATAYASAWLDRRETSTALASRRYSWMRPKWIKKNVGIPPTRTTYKGKTAVYFGGKQSGKCMDLTVSNTTATAADVTYCRHVFAVIGVEAAGGAIISVRSSPNDFHPGSTDCSIASFIINSTADAVAQRCARFYYNGRQVNGVTQYPVKGTYQLIEYDMPYARPTFNALYNDRNIENRAGGDYLAEVIVFKTQLSEADRLAVERYLMAKWGCYQNVPSVAPVIAKGAEVVLTNDVESLSAVTLRGGGRAVKRGAGRLLVGAGDTATRFDGALSVEAGSVRLVANDIPLTLAVGKTLTADAGTAGEDVSVGSADEGTVVKAGSGDIVATAVPNEAKCLRVTGGTLTLRAPCSYESIVPGSVTNVVLPDPSFEYYQNANRNMLSGANGWWATARYPGSTMDSSAFTWSYLYGSERWPCDAPSPDGTSSLGIKADVAAYTKDLTVPETGVYELSFWANARYDDSSYTSFVDLLIGPDADHLVKLSTTVNGRTSFYYRQSYVTPVLTAGTTYQLWLRPQFLNGDGLTMFDGMKLRLVSRGGRLNEWKIPNGGFEDIDPTNTVGTAAYKGVVFTTNTHVFGWTFVQSPLSAQKAASLNRDQCSVGVFIPGLSKTSVDSGSGSYNCYSPAFQREGCVRLGLFSTGGLARTTFTPPAGLWRLKTEMQRVRFSYLCSTPASKDAPLVNARLASPAGETDLGTAGTVYTNMGMEDVIWPNVFTTDGTTAYTLTLSNTYYTSSVFLDNLVLLPVEDATYDYISNGSFETDGGWTYVADPTHAAQTKTCRMEYAYLPASMGCTKYDGSYYAYVVAAGAVVQDVALPKAGAYRLTFNLSTRFDSAGGTGSGRNPLRAWVAQGGVTNEIGRTLAIGTNFLQRAYVFTVPAAGTYQVGIQGTSAGVDRATRVDGVSLRAAGEWAAETAATPTLPEDLRVEVAADAMLDLAYSGTNVVRAVRLGGQRVTGIVNAAKYPSFIRGTGALNVLPLGLFFVVR